MGRSYSLQRSCRTVVPIRRGRGGIAEGLQGLAHGFSSGLTGIYRSPAAGYGSGSSGGLAVGVGRGLLGAVGLPLSGALDLVSSVSAGIASSTGITHAREPGRSGVLLGEFLSVSHPASAEPCFRFRLVWPPRMRSSRIDFPIQGLLQCQCCSCLCC